MVCVVWCAVCVVVCAVCIVWCVLCGVRCVLWDVLCVLCGVRCVLWDVLCVLCCVGLRLLPVFAILPLQMNQASATSHISSPPFEIGAAACVVLVSMPTRGSSVGVVCSYKLGD